MTRFVLILKRADKIIRVPNQAGLALGVPLDDFLKPQVQHVVQIHVGQDWRNDSALGSPRQRMRHLSVGIEHPGPEPFPDQPQQLLVADPSAQHLDECILIEVVEESLNVRFNPAQIPACRFLADGQANGITR